jgi:hypothetical protein
MFYIRSIERYGQWLYIVNPRTCGILQTIEIIYMAVCSIGLYDVSWCVEWGSIKKQWYCKFQIVFEVLDMLYSVTTFLTIQFLVLWLIVCMKCMCVVHIRTMHHITTIYYVFYTLFHHITNEISVMPLQRHETKECMCSLISNVAFLRWS